jgi:hypothetical protein
MSSTPIVLRALALPFALGFLGTGLSEAQMRWDQSTPSSLPPARSGNGHAQDTLRDRTVIFAGQGAAGNLADTWEWDGSDWTQLAPVHVPGARRRPAMAFDAARGVSVLFGGYSGSFDYADTWEWDGSDWTQRAPTTSPPGRDTLAMAYDAARGVIVMYGGSAGSLLGDTWEYDGTTWVNRSGGASPGARQSHAMAYDARRGVIVLFGGYTGSGTPNNDTWEWDGASWTRRTPAAVPSPRWEMGLAYDSARQRIVMCGGWSGSALLDDVWEYDGTTWAQRSTMNATLPPRRSFTFQYQPARRRCVAYGGVTTTNDTWEYGPNVFSAYETYGSGCVGSNGTPALGSTDIGPFYDDTFTSAVTQLPLDPLTVAYGLVGFLDTTWNGIPLPLDLTPAGFTGCTIYQEIILPYPLTPSGGSASWDVVIPAVSLIQGLQFYQQVLVSDPLANPAGFVLSNPARATIGAR